MSEDTAKCSACGNPGETVRLGDSPEPLCRGCARERSGTAPRQSRFTAGRPGVPKRRGVDADRAAWEDVLEGHPGPRAIRCAGCRVSFTVSAYRWHESHGHAVMACLWCGGNVVRGDVEAAGSSEVYPERAGRLSGRWQPPAFCSLRCLFSARATCLRCRKAPPAKPGLAVPCEECAVEEAKAWADVRARRGGHRKDAYEADRQEKRTERRSIP